MAQKYEKKQPKSMTARFLKFALIFLAAFLVGYWCATHNGVTRLLSSIQSTFHENYFHKSKPRAKHPTEQAALPKPKFEFYTLLAHEQAASPDRVWPSVSKTLEPSQSTETTQTKSVSNTPREAASHVVEKSFNAPSQAEARYMLQVASFRKQADADRVKADLILNGFEARVVMISREGAHWYRVMLGPFASRMQAEKAQVEVARSEHLMGMVLKVT